MSKQVTGQKIDFVIGVDFQNCFMEGGNLGVAGANEQFRQETTDAMVELKKTSHLIFTGDAHSKNSQTFAENILKAYPEAHVVDPVTNKLEKLSEKYIGLPIVDNLRRPIIGKDGNPIPVAWTVHGVAGEQDPSKNSKLALTQEVLPQAVVAKGVGDKTDLFSFLGTDYAGIEDLKKSEGMIYIQKQLMKVAEAAGYKDEKTGEVNVKGFLKENEVNFHTTGLVQNICVMKSAVHLKQCLDDIYGKDACKVNIATQLTKPIFLNEGMKQAYHDTINKNGVTESHLAPEELVKQTQQNFASLPDGMKTALCQAVSKASDVKLLVGGGPEDRKILDQRIDREHAGDKSKFIGDLIVSKDSSNLSRSQKMGKQENAYNQAIGNQAQESNRQTQIRKAAMQEMRSTLGNRSVKFEDAKSAVQSKLPSKPKEPGPQRG